MMYLTLNVTWEERQQLLSVVDQSSYGLWWSAQHCVEGGFLVTSPFILTLKVSQWKDNIRVAFSAQLHFLDWKVTTFLLPYWPQDFLILDGIINVVVVASERGTTSPLILEKDLMIREEKKNCQCYRISIEIGEIWVLERSAIQRFAHCCSWETCK